MENKELDRLVRVSDEHEKRISKLEQAQAACGIKFKELEKECPHKDKVEQEVKELNGTVAELSEKVHDVYEWKAAEDQRTKSFEDKIKENTASIRRLDVSITSLVKSINSLVTWKATEEVLSKERSTRLKNIQWLIGVAVTIMLGVAGIVLDKLP